MPTDPRDEFGLVASTNALRLIPNNYGRARGARIFTPIPVSSTVMRMEEHKGTITLIPSKPRGADGTIRVKDGRRARFLEMAHFPLNGRVEGAASQNVQSWDGSGSSDSVTDAVIREMAAHRQNHAITEEFWYVGALKGVLLDSDGTTVYYNLFTEFEITPKVIDFAFSSATTKVRNMCLNVTRNVEDNITGDVYSGVEAWCSPEFFDALISHANVEKAFINYEAAQDRVGGDPRSGFMFGGVRFSEYRANVNGIKFIPANEAYAFPVGTTNTFECYWGPPVLDSVTKANTMGTPGPYALQTQDPKGRWVDVDSEMNCLPVCRRPGVLAKLTMS